MTSETPAPKTDLAHDVLRTEGRALDAIFAPRSVAVVGATERAGSVGRTILWNLISSPFGGTVFPVNPGRPNVMGICAYPSIKDLPEPKTYADGWVIGKPDIVFEMPKEQTIQAEGVVEYQHFVTKTNFKEDVWVQGHADEATMLGVSNDYQGWKQRLPLLYGHARHACGQGCETGLRRKPRCGRKALT